MMNASVSLGYSTVLVGLSIVRVQLYGNAYNSSVVHAAAILQYRSSTTTILVCSIIISALLILICSSTAIVAHMVQ